MATILSKKKLNMKKILITLTLAGVFMACGKSRDSSANSDSTTHINSTTPPATSDTTNPIGVMMSDTSITAADSLNRQK